MRQQFIHPDLGCQEKSGLFLRQLKKIDEDVDKAPFPVVEETGYSAICCPVSGACFK